MPLGENTAPIGQIGITFYSPAESAAVTAALDAAGPAAPGEAAGAFGESLAGAALAIEDPFAALAGEIGDLVADLGLGTVSIQGVEETQQALREYYEMIQRMIEEACAEAASMCKSQMDAGTPFRTGRLMAGNFASAAGTVVTAGNTVPYAIFNLYGTCHMHGHDWITPAIDGAQSWLDARLAEIAAIPPPGGPGGGAGFGSSASSGAAGTASAEIPDYTWTGFEGAAAAV